MASETGKIEIATDEDVAKFAGGSEAMTAATKEMSEESPSTAEGRLAAVQKECDEFKDKMLRAQAECANITKRLTQERAEALKLAGMGVARSILPVLDNFERTLANLREAHAEDPVIAGVKLVADQLTKVLKDHGVEPIESLGKSFDPMLHEALMHDRQSSGQPGTITQELERGYTMHGRVLRHAKVAVAAAPDTAAPVDGDGENADGE